jgi:hypothetical protein
LVGSAGVMIYSSGLLLIANDIGNSSKNIVALTLGTGLAVPTIFLMYQVRDGLIPVDPVRAIVSSLIFIGLLAIFFPRSARSFITELEQTGPLLFTVVAFNIFGDAVSLVETRWMLRLSRGLSAVGIIFMLILDLVLSGLIYLVLPEISAVNWSAFGLAIQFEGPSPWMGILFWSTFFTSFLFYLFVVTMLMLRLLYRFTLFVAMLDKWFAVYRHPLRLITAAGVILETVIFLFFALLLLAY